MEGLNGDYSPSVRHSFHRWYGFHAVPYAQAASELVLFLALGRRIEGQHRALTTNQEGDTMADWRTPWLINIGLLIVYVLLQVWVGFRKQEKPKRKEGEGHGRGI